MAMMFILRDLRKSLKSWYDYNEIFDQNINIINFGI